MVIEPLKITYDQDFTEVDDPENEGKKKSIPVEGTGKTEDIHVKRLKWRQRGRIYSPLKGVGFEDSSVEVQMQFVSDIICESVCDAEGKPTIKPDDLDDLQVWTDARRNAYFSAITRYQSPNAENSAKNSSSTSNAKT